MILGAILGPWFTVFQWWFTTETCQTTVKPLLLLKFDVFSLFLLLFIKLGVAYICTWLLKILAPHSTSLLILYVTYAPSAPPSARYARFGARLQALKWGPTTRPMHTYYAQYIRTLNAPSTRTIRLAHTNTSPRRTHTSKHTRPLHEHIWHVHMHP